MSTLATIAGPSSFLPAITDGKQMPRFSPLSRDVGVSRRDAALKRIAQTERLASVRPASQLELRPRPEMISSGVAELDSLTEGIPRGCLTEVCGPASSGKTSVLLATLAAATRRGESCVLIDASDSFNPGSGAEAGIDFGRLLWVRCGKSSCVEHSSSESKFCCHSAFADDRQPRTNDWFSADDGRRTTYDGFPNNRRSTTNDGFTARLEQVLKSTDLILQSGGFGVVALDLAGIPEKFARRIPLASWFRFQRAVEHTKTALLVISEIPCAQTCAAMAMKMSGQASGVRSQASGKPSHAEVLEKLQIESEILRSRLERRPMHSVRTSFRTLAVRAG